MSSFRFSLLALFGFVAFVAAGCAALARPSELLEIIVSAAMLACLLFAVLASIIDQWSPRRAFWIGFAIAGWGFFLVNANPHSRFLPTTRMTVWLQLATQAEDDPLAEFRDNERDFQVARRGLQERWELTQETAQWLWPLAFGALGGLVARHLYFRRERERNATKPSGLPPPGSVA
jgi:hypothetical protein